MERHFTLPVSIAAALHVGVFFGLPRGTKPVHPTNAEKVVLWQPINVPPPEEEKIVDPTPSEEKVPVTTPLPRNAENYAEMKPRDFAMERPPLPEYTTHDVPNLGVPVGLTETTPKGPGVFNILSLDDAPRARAQPPPVYPNEAKREGLRGDVTVEFVVDVNGRVISQHVVDSSNRIFDEAALRAVAKWRFEPGHVQGRLVQFRMIVPIKFSLTE
jgi:protein TonB